MDNSIHDIAISFKVISRYFVDPGVTFSGNGLGWSTAFKTLQEALVATDQGAKIWVASGTYYPTENLDRSKSFELKDGHQIYGGFDGTETERSQRDILANPTILSGDIAMPDNTVDNSFHVIHNTGVSSTCLIDGFRILDGNANVTGDSYGGGILNENRLTIVRNCVLEKNFASRGSAIYNAGAKIIIEDCEIIGLDAEMIHNDESNLEVKSVVKLIKN